MTNSSTSKVTRASTFSCSREVRDALAWGTHLTRSRRRGIFLRFSDEEEGKFGARDAGNQHHESDVVAILNDDDDLADDEEILLRQVPACYMILSAAPAATNASLVKKHVMLLRGLG